MPLDYGNIFLLGYVSNISGALGYGVFCFIYSLVYRENDLLKQEKFIQHMQSQRINPKYLFNLLIISLMPFALLLCYIIKAYGVATYFLENPKKSWIDYLSAMTDHANKHPDAISLYFPKF